MLAITKQISLYNHTAGRTAGIKYIVIHDVGYSGSTAKNNADYFGNPVVPEASAHYFVDDAHIYQVVNDSDTAWHCGDGKGQYGITNSNSIGIEMIVTNDKITETTQNNTIGLVKQLQQKYNIDNAHVVRHYDASHKNCPAYFNLSGNWAGWTAFKAKLTGIAVTPVAPVAPVTKPQSGIGSNMVNKVTYQKTDDAVNVRTAQTTQSAVIKTLPKGTVFTSNRYASGENVDGKGYKWFEVNGHGWVYGGLITPTSKPVAKPSIPQIAVDGQWGKELTKRLQQYFGLQYVDGVISHQYRSNANRYLYAAQFDNSLTGSLLVKAIQKKLGLKQDGLLGSDTIKALQKHFGTPVDGVISPTSSMVKAMQQALNRGTF